MSDYTLEEALADARGWVEGTTFHKGQRGWKPALAVILDEFDCVTKDHADCDEFAAALMKERDELAARLAEAERDAARYRWLRVREASWHSDGQTLTLNETPAIDAGFGRALDAAIDAAMRARGEG